MGSPGYYGDALVRVVDELWEGGGLSLLQELIAIPAQSPAFDPQWEATGDLRRAVDAVNRWSLSRPISGLRTGVIEGRGLSPLLLLEIPASGTAATGETVVFYGHLDKQPPGGGWREGLSPWLPTREGDRLFGRGAVDDGYAVVAYLIALEALRAAGGAHARCVGLIETSEESGSVHLPQLLDLARDRIGDPSLIVALDASAGSYDRLWSTVSLRAVVDATVRVGVLNHPHHCGMASGIVPSSFRIIRQLLSRIEDERTGELLPPFLHVRIPDGRRLELAEVAAELGRGVCAPFDFVDGAGPVSGDPVELLLNNTWRPTMAVLAQDGLPPLAAKAHLLRAHTAVELSFRFPPGLDVSEAKRQLTQLLTTDPPYGARVTVEWTSTCSGWNAPDLPAWLKRASQEASGAFFGRPPLAFGCGGAIPFVNMLQQRHPDAAFFISGVCGPGANAHGPNEFLHLSAAKRLTCCVAHLLDAHARSGRGGEVL
jgi:acetylornithine deacetylase/succinyl-diaminopimelate desuccinylase-like protein